MAVYFPAFGDGLTRDGSFLDPALDWTISGWALMPDPPPSDGYTFRLIGAGDFTAPWLFLGRDGIDNLAYGAADNGGGEIDAGGPGFYGTPTDQWVYFALRYAAATTEISFIVNGIQIGDAGIVDLSSVPPITPEFAATAESSAGGNISIGFLREWQAWLTETELQAEMESYAAVRTSDLLSDTKLVTAEDLTDSSGNGHDWTLLGFADTVDGPFGPVGDYVFISECNTPPTPIVGCVTDLPAS